jgi:O-6-methylguanine DNA methyltransferase
MQIYTADLKTPVGTIHLASSEAGLVLVGLSTREKFTAELADKYPDALVVPDQSKNRIALDQLREYFAGKRQTFSVPMACEGTAFQKKVWRALQRIPYGQTVTYKEIARQIGEPKAFRAVGLANNRNPIGIIVPCHRVIGANGKLIGYGGGLQMKEKLLQLEGALLM